MLTFTASDISVLAATRSTVKVALDIDEGDGVAECNVGNLLSHIAVGDIVQHVGAAALLDSIGEADCREHFGIKDDGE